MEEWKQRALRSIPPVNAILAAGRLADLGRRYPANLLTEVAEEALGEVRERILGAAEPEALAAVLLKAEDLAGLAADRLHRRFTLNLRRVINASGVVLHTNLGRSLLSATAAEAVAVAATRYSNLELDLETGERGSRYSHVEEVLRRLTGAEAAMVVNNNAAAVLLVLSTVARGRAVIVSRGELVEIGGSFRIPEVMVQSGAALREVGTTNKTRLADYEAAVGPDTGALLKVHTSNYRLTGFVESVSLSELAALGRRTGLPVVNDLGSGVVLDLRRFGVGDEPTVQESVAAGADLVTFSGDKLLGGPQAGLIVGRAALLKKIRLNPLTRALRIDKLTLAALEATLRLYQDEARARREIPTLAMLTRPAEELEPEAQGLARLLAEAAAGRAAVEVLSGVSQAGGGSLPGVDLQTWLVGVRPRQASPAEVERCLRRAEPPVLARIQRDQLLFDPRTILPDEPPLVAAALRRALETAPERGR